jgi:hypothetical protein
MLNELPGRSNQRLDYLKYNTNTAPLSEAKSVEKSHDSTPSKHSPDLYPPSQVPISSVTFFS